MHIQQTKMVSKALALLAWVALPASAEQFKEFDNIVVYYNALKTDFLSAEVAKDYGITRSRNRAMINISVQEKTSATSQKPIKANVTAFATNLANQLKKIPMREVHDGEVTYYIGEVPISDKEIINFKVDVNTPNSDNLNTVEFQQQFFTN